MRLSSTAVHGGLESGSRGTSVARLTRLVIPCAVLIASAALASAADARMRSSKLADGTCMTTGGGRIVEIPGFPGESIDRRLLRDVRWLAKRYAILVTDGYSLDEVHAASGEHPLGLALDIVPNKATGGSWAQINALARWAEPRQDEPRTPFRWVGYTGDQNHGPRHHLHLSWSHSVAKPGRTARTVYTLRCPKPLTPPPAPPLAPPPPDTSEPPPEPAPSGGIPAKPAPTPGGIAAPVPEDDGVGSGGIAAR